MNLYSYHIFLFPFIWQPASQTGNQSGKEEDLKTLVKELEGKDGKWKRKEFAPQTPLQYNEFHYFYGFVRGILYDRSDGNSFLTHLEHNDFKDGNKQYRFLVKWKDEEAENEKEYQLQIDSILLNLYSTGVGVLSFHLNNRSENQREEIDILRINQYGRRLFPPFFGVDETEPDHQLEFSKGLGITQMKELAVWIDLGEENSREKFERFKHVENLQSGNFLLPHFFQPLFPTGLWTGDERDMKGKFTMIPALDDRMFVVCWYGNDTTAGRLNPESEKNLKENSTTSYLTDDFWYKYIHVDGEIKTCQNKEMTQKLLEKATYPRWSNYNTFFGMSRYGFACLTSTHETLKKPSINATFLINHIQTIYYKMVELVLVQRASVLRFSDEITHVANLARSGSDDAKVAAEIRQLYAEYIRFVNKIFFREVTAQEQGIELYDLMQETMRVRGQVEDLNREFGELHSLANLIEERRRNIQGLQLNYLAAIFLPASLVAAIFGFSTISPEMKFSDGPAEWHFWIPFTIAFAASLLGCLIVWLISKRKS